jgi:mannonate dehydratase
MKDNRRNFIRKSAALAAAVSVGGITTSMVSPLVVDEKTVFGPGTSNVAKDAGMQSSEAYFSGMNERKIALLKQMDVFGAVGGISPKIAGTEAKPYEEKTVAAVKEAWSKVGLNFNVVEGPPSLGEKTKLGLEGRDEEIANFITFMKNLKQYGGVDTICYNWMPVVSWFRTKMDTPGRGGALMTSFDYEDAKKLPVTEYGQVSKETLWKTLEYFLKAVVPEAEKIGMNLSLHPDDPQVDSLKGISRIMTSVKNFDRMLNIVPSKYSGLTMCQGNFSLMGEDIPALVKRWGKEGKINYVHFRNVRDLSGKVPSTKFTETFHDEGQIDMYAAMKAYYDIGYKGAIRPDHVPTMFGDNNDRPGYSTIGTLFALGYMKGLIESIQKKANQLS